jgi:hypothetical protein
LITLTARGGAGTPVGPGLGSGWLGLTSGAGVGGDVTVRRAARVEVCTTDRPDPHPATSDAIVRTAMNEARWTRALT